MICPEKMEETDIDIQRRPMVKRPKQKMKQMLSTSSFTKMVGNDGQTTLDLECYQFPRLMTQDNEISSIQPSLFDNIPPTIYFGLLDEKSEYDRLI